MSKVSKASGLQRAWAVSSSAIFSTHNLFVEANMFYSTLADVLSGHPTVLAFTIHWVLHCCWGYMFPSDLCCARFREVPNLTQSAKPQMFSIIFHLSKQIPCRRHRHVMILSSQLELYVALAIMDHSFCVSWGNTSQISLQLWLYLINNSWDFSPI